MKYSGRINRRNSPAFLLSAPPGPAFTMKANNPQRKSFV